MWGLINVKSTFGYTNFCGLLAGSTVYGNITVITVKVMNLNLQLSFVSP